MHLTLRQLKVFEAVARHLSFSRAAVELHLSQPAVSMQVKLLEDSVGLPLFEHLGKKTFLTEAGRELFHSSRAIAAQLAELDQSLAQMKGGQRGKLRVSVAPTGSGSPYTVACPASLFAGPAGVTCLKLSRYMR